VSESDLLDPYDRLVAIEVLGRRVEVPENNRLLRCFQFLSLETISYGDFCWNGDCTNCQIWLRDAAQPAAPPRPALACRTDVSEGMVITHMSPHIKIRGVNE
jgi:NADH dehydrogenase/NADH:ubiquinone oxidoreductase subunit G